MKIHSPHGVPPSKRILRFRFWGLWVPTSFRGPKRRHSRCRTVSPFRGTGGRGLGDDGMFLGMFKEFWQDFDGFYEMLMGFWWIWIDFDGFGWSFMGAMGRMLTNNNYPVGRRERCSYVLLFPVEWGASRSYDEFPNHMIDNGNMISIGYFDYGDWDVRGISYWFSTLLVEYVMRI